MKSVITRSTLPLFLILSSLLLVGNSMAQTRTRIKAYYSKDNENNKVISVALIKGSGKTMGPVAGADIDVLALSGEEEGLLATITTDNEGMSDLYIQDGFLLPVDEKGYSQILCRFVGNDTLKASKKKIKFVDLNLELHPTEDDSLRFINVIASHTTNDTTAFVEDVDIILGVERLYSTLTLEKGSTDEDGRVQFLFPKDIPGDSIGAVTITVKVNEDRKYGTITKQTKLDWGTPVTTHETNDRSLFGEQAPMWMIIAVFVILAGAWFNFLLAIYKVSRIKGLDPNLDGQTENY